MNRQHRRSKMISLCFVLMSGLLVFTPPPNQLDADESKPSLQPGESIWIHQRKPLIVPLPNHKEESRGEQKLQKVKRLSLHLPQSALEEEEITTKKGFESRLSESVKNKLEQTTLIEVPRTIRTGKNQTRVVPSYYLYTARPRVNIVRLKLSSGQQQQIQSGSDVPVRIKLSYLNRLVRQEMVQYYNEPDNAGLYDILRTAGTGTFAIGTAITIASGPVGWGSMAVIAMKSTSLGLSYYAKYVSMQNSYKKQAHTDVPRYWISMKDQTERYQQGISRDSDNVSNTLPGRIQDDLEEDQQQESDNSPTKSPCSLTFPNGSDGKVLFYGFTPAIQKRPTLNLMDYSRPFLHYFNEFSVDPSDSPYLRTQVVPKNDPVASIRQSPWEEFTRISRTELLAMIQNSDDTQSPSSTPRSQQKRPPQKQIIPTAPSSKNNQPEKPISLRSDVRKLLENGSIDQFVSVKFPGKRDAREQFTNQLFGGVQSRDTEVRIYSENAFTHPTGRLNDETHHLSPRFENLPGVSEGTTNTATLSMVLDGLRNRAINYALQEGPSYIPEKLTNSPLAKHDAPSSKVSLNDDCETLINTLAIPDGKPKFETIQQIHSQKAARRFLMNMMKRDEYFGEFGGFVRQRTQK